MDGHSPSIFCKKHSIMCFAVLWIPTVNHIPIPFDKPFHGGERTLNISDLPSEDFFVKVKTVGRDVRQYSVTALS